MLTRAAWLWRKWESRFSSLKVIKWFELNPVSSGFISFCLFIYRFLKLLSDFLSLTLLHCRFSVTQHVGKFCDFINLGRKQRWCTILGLLLILWKQGGAVYLFVWFVSFFVSKITLKQLNVFLQYSVGGCISPGGTHLMMVWICISGQIQDFFIQTLWDEAFLK